jgi:AraC family transcriptional activator of pobA
MYMPKSTTIPVNNFVDATGSGFWIEKIVFEDLPPLEHWGQPERHDRHTFFLLERGSAFLEIDFHQHMVVAPALIYMHPDQVHRMMDFTDLTVYAWAIHEENMKSEYAELLQEITPAVPVSLDPAISILLIEGASFCHKLTAQSSGVMKSTLLRDQFNSLTGLVLSLYLERQTPIERLSRAEQVTRAFRALLFQHFVKFKRPADYAGQLHVSSPYLNECVRKVTGQSVTWHIQQRIILEAKRLIYHSGQSLKEISAALGYDDYAYFSRLFTHVTGISPVVFRRKNLG